MLKLVFEWCRIHIKTVLAQHYSLVVFTYAWFIQATPVQVGPGPPKSAQVNPNLQALPGSPRFSQVLPGSPRFSQVLPGSPRKLVISCDFVGFREFLGEPGCYFLRFCGFPGFPGRTWVLFSAFSWVSGISWENLGVIFCAFVGFPGFPGRTWVETVGDGPGRAARVSSGKSGWRVDRYFDPQFPNFCRRRCRPLWPAGLPRFEV